MPGFRPALCGLMPHPPIVVPAVGRDRLEDCRATYEACCDFARRLVAARPARLFLISPHSPRRLDAFGIWSGKRLRGDLRDFGAPRAAVDLPNDTELAAALRAEAGGRGVPVWEIPPEPLDHGAVVPLWFLADAGWSGPTSIASLPYPGEGDLAAFGAAAAAAASALTGPAAVVASGDMSHRTRPGAPAGHHPRAREFDRQVVDLVRAGRLGALQDIAPDLRELAAEDVADSATVAAAALDFRAHNVEVLSYEDPFGVGYLVAVFHDGDHDELEVLPALAREAVAAHLQGRAPATPPPPQGALAERAPVFVTLHRCSDRSLRGCIGSLEPRFDDLVRETADRALAAAFDDPRFPPVQAGELADLHFEVSVLGRAEPVRGLEELDPRIYGVIVSDREGRRGVLLPDIPEVTSAAQQVDIARRKAGIPPGAPVQIERFPVRKASEPWPANRELKA